MNGKAAVAVALVLALAVGGFVLWQNNQNACDRWREDVRAVDVGLVEALDGGDVGPWIEERADLKDRRPRGCPIPR